MKFAIIGLGSLGRHLALNLSTLGHDVLGIDKQSHRLDVVKQYINSVVKLDTTDVEALESLSLEKYDYVYVTYSKDFGISVQTVALLKSIGVKKLIVRAMSETHRTVLESIGVYNIIEPEKDFALKYALDMLTHGLFSDKYIIDKDLSLITMDIPKSMIGEKISKNSFSSTFGLDLVCVKRPLKEKNILGVTTSVYKAFPIGSEPFVLEAGDQLVVFGNEKKLKIFADL